MDPDAPFSGTLLLPVSRSLRFRSPVLSGDTLIATIRRPVVSLRRRFAIHGADGSRWASGTETAVHRTRGSGPLVVLRDQTIMLRDGPILTGLWGGEEITLTDVLGRRMAAAECRSDLRLTVHQPVLTLLQAIGLARLLQDGR